MREILKVQLLLHDGSTKHGTLQATPKCSIWSHPILKEDLISHEPRLNGCPESNYRLGISISTTMHSLFVGAKDTSHKYSSFPRLRPSWPDSPILDLLQTEHAPYRSGSHSSRLHSRSGCSTSKSACREYIPRVDYTVVARILNVLTVASSCDHCREWDALCTSQLYVVFEGSAESVFDADDWMRREGEDYEEETPSRWRRWCRSRRSSGAVSARSATWSSESCRARGAVN